MIINPKLRHEKKTNKDRGTSEKKRLVGIPNIRGVLKGLRRIFKQYNRDVFYMPFNTMWQILVRP